MTRACICCGAAFPVTRANRVYCSRTCNGRDHKAEAKQLESYRAVRPKPPPTEAEVRRAIEAMDEGVRGLKERFSSAVLEAARAARAMRRGAA